MIGKAVYQQLLATPAVMALCKWIYPHIIPQDREPPAITYKVDSVERDRLLDGEGTYNLAQVSLDVYTNKYNDSHVIADAIEVALIDFRGTLGKAATAVDCNHLRLERRFDIFEAATRLHRVSLQFTIGYEIG